jgi:hypothetical protein
MALPAAVAAKLHQSFSCKRRLMVSVERLNIQLNALNSLDAFCDPGYFLLPA